METQIADPAATYKVSPEALEIAQTYLGCFDLTVTAQTLGVDMEKVAYYLKKPEVRKLVDTIFIEQGYMNRSKIQDVMDKLIEIKLEEMEESEMGSSKDILDIMQAQHKMRMEELKLMQPSGNVPKQQVNIQDNRGAVLPAEFGENYGGLVSKLLKVQE